jgi:hypothetical protein
LFLALGYIATAVKHLSKQETTGIPSEFLMTQCGDSRYVGKKWYFCIAQTSEVP